MLDKASATHAAVAPASAQRDPVRANTTMPVSANGAHCADKRVQVRQRDQAVDVEAERVPAATARRGGRSASSTNW